MADEIIIKYKADVSGLKAELKSVEESLKKVDAESEKTGNNISKGLVS